MRELRAATTALFRGSHMLHVIEQTTGSCNESMRLLLIYLPLYWNTLTETDGWIECVAGKCA